MQSAVLQEFDYVFSENGLVAHKRGELLAVQVCAALSRTTAICCIEQAAPGAGTQPDMSLASVRPLKHPPPPTPPPPTPHTHTPHTHHHHHDTYPLSPCSR